MAQLKGMLTGPAAKPYVHTISQLESEFAKFQDAGDDDMDLDDLEDDELDLLDEGVDDSDDEEFAADDVEGLGELRWYLSNYI